MVTNNMNNFFFLVSQVAFPLIFVSMVVGSGLRVPFSHGYHLPLFSNSIDSFLEEIKFLPGILCFLPMIKWQTNYQLKQKLWEHTSVGFVCYSKIMTCLYLWCEELCWRRIKSLLGGTHSNMYSVFCTPHTAWFFFSFCAYIFVQLYLQV